MTIKLGLPDFRQAEFSGPSPVSEAILDCLRTNDSIDSILKTHKLTKAEFYRQYYTTFSIAPTALRHLVAGKHLDTATRVVHHLEVWLPTIKVTGGWMDYTAEFPTEMFNEIPMTAPILGVRVAEVQMRRPGADWDSNRDVEITAANSMPTINHMGIRTEQLEIESGDVKVAVVNTSHNHIYGQDPIRLQVGLLRAPDDFDECELRVKVRMPVVSVGRAPGLTGELIDLRGPLLYFLKNPPGSDDRTAGVESNLHVTVAPYQAYAQGDTLSPSIGVVVVMNNQFQFMARLHHPWNEKPYGSVKELMHSAHGNWFKAQVRSILSPYVDGDMTLVFGFPLEDGPTVLNSALGM